MRTMDSTRVMAGAALVGAAAFAARCFAGQPPYSFAGKSVLITGGSRGLGLILARQLAARGATLFIASRTAEQVREAEHDLRARGARAYGWICDVRDPAAITAAVSRVVLETGRIDVLINNAGIIQATPLEHATPDDYADSLQTHFWAPFHAMRAALPHMQRAGRGRILNISSVGGRIAVPHLNPYSVGKAALAALSDGVRAEVARYGVRVTTATPGLMRTGSHVNVDVRGQHQREAQLFGLMVSSSLTSLDAERAGRQILEACRRGRAHVTPGWQAKVAIGANALAPETMAAILAASVRWVLPGPTTSSEGDRTRRVHELDLGWIGSLFPRAEVTRNNETPSTPR